jgi:hypothetical protein
LFLVFPLVLWYGSFCLEPFFSSLLLDIYVQLNMFRASSRPTSGAQ